MSTSTIVEYLCLFFIFFTFAKTKGEQLWKV